MPNLYLEVLIEFRVVDSVHVFTKGGQAIDNQETVV